MPASFGDLVGKLKSYIPNKPEQSSFVRSKFKFVANPNVLPLKDSQSCVAVISQSDPAVSPYFFESNTKALQYVRSTGSTALSCYSLDLKSLDEALNKLEEPTYIATLCIDNVAGPDNKKTVFQIAASDPSRFKAAKTALTVSGLVFLVSSIVAFVALSCFQDDLVLAAATFGLLVVLGLSAVIVSCCINPKNSFNEPVAAVNRPSRNQYKVTHVDGVPVSGCSNNGINNGSSTI